MKNGFEDSGVGTINWEQTPVIAHVAAAGLLPFLVESYTNEPNKLEARTDRPSELVALLKSHPKFKSGRWWKLHKDVGENLIEFRSFKGELVPEIKKSLQFIVDRTTGRVYADLDRRNPYEDLVGLFGHLRDVIRGEKTEKGHA